MKFSRVVVLVMLIIIFLFPLHEVSSQSLSIEFDQVIGGQGSEPGQFNLPEAILIDLEGNIFIVDAGNNRIQKLNPTGMILRQVGGLGRDFGQFDNPTDIIAGSKLDLYIVDKNNHRLVRYDRDLNFIATHNIDETQDANLRVRYPEAAAISFSQDKFVIDSENRRIVQFNAFNEAKTSFGGYNSTGLPLQNPAGIAIYRNETIYVSDKMQKALFKYDYFGNLIEIVEKDKFIDPDGIDIDESGNVYVCDPGAKSVKVFDHRSRLINVINDPFLREPVDVAVTQKHIYILDREASYIFIYNIIR